jgi:glyceraldehyde 3-phosphate dehydrogenase
MALRIAINGFGRIGRLVYRAAVQQGIEVVAVNDLVPSDSLAYLVNYDTMHGRFGHRVTATADGFECNGKKTQCLSEKEPSKLPWKDLGVDIVLESTGRFTEFEGASQHLAAGAKRVIISAPTKSDDKVRTFVFKVNHEQYDPSKDTIISNASCTTNCLAPVVKVLLAHCGIEEGLMTTIHSYTNDQNILDLPHKDLRRGRAAAINIVPSATGAARAIGEVIPAMKGKLNGGAFRVPTPTGSFTDLVVELKAGTTVTVAEINAAFKEAAEGPMKGVLAYTDEPIVLQDIVSDPHSSIYDSELTLVIGGNMVKVGAWYDNEWGYSNRAAEMLKLLATGA